MKNIIMWVTEKSGFQPRRQGSESTRPLKAQGIHAEPEHPSASHPAFFAQRHS